MTNTASKSLKTLLLQYLQGKTPKYEQLKLRVVQSSPLQLSDDNVNFIESLQLEKVIGSQDALKDVTSIKLKKWAFSFNKVPGAHGFYFDIEAQDYELLKEGNKASPIGTDMTNILEDNEILFNFEVKKRAELASVYRVDKEQTGKGKKSKSKDEKFVAKSEVLYFF